MPENLSSDREPRPPFPHERTEGLYGRADLLQDVPTAVIDILGEDTVLAIEICVVASADLAERASSPNPFVIERDVQSNIGDMPELSKPQRQAFNLQRCASAEGTYLSTEDQARLGPLVPVRESLWSYYKNKANEVIQQTKQAFNLFKNIGGEVENIPEFNHAFSDAEVQTLQELQDELKKISALLPGRDVFVALKTILTLKSILGSPNPRVPLKITDPQHSQSAVYSVTADDNTAMKIPVCADDALDNGYIITEARRIMTHEARAVIVRRYGAEAYEATKSSARNAAIMFLDSGTSQLIQAFSQAETGFPDDEKDPKSAKLAVVKAYIKEKLESLESRWEPFGLYYEAESLGTIARIKASTAGNTGNNREDGTEAPPRGDINFVKGVLSGGSRLTPLTPAQNPKRISAELHRLRREHKRGHSEPVFRPEEIGVIVAIITGQFDRLAAILDAVSKSPLLDLAATKNPELVRKISQLDLDTVLARINTVIQDSKLSDSKTILNPLDGSDVARVEETIRLRKYLQTDEEATAKAN